MAAFVQSTGIQAVGAVDSVGKAYDSDVTAGNLLVAACVSAGTDLPSSAVTDTQGNEWRSDVVRQQEVVDAYAATVAVFSAVAGGSGPLVVTLDAAASAYQSLALAEFSPASGFVWAPAPERLDGFGGAGDATSGGSLSCGVVTAGSGVVAGVLSHAEVFAVAVTPTTGWTESFEDEDVTERAFSAIYKLTAAGSHVPGWTLSPNAVALCVAAGYKETAQFPDPDERFTYADFPHKRLRDEEDVVEEPA